ncbi:MAG: hypothetical protein BA862_03565 [Desulfobulbaceae bacterium S3730MH12]|nr:MAG: hypothetical protein BA862_03565 [Desulfobulbaceae bacterium S3730MH12]
MTVQSSAASLHRNLPGKVRAAKRSELSFKVSGPLVKKGDLVAHVQRAMGAFILFQPEAKHSAWIERARQSMRSE